MTHVLTHWLSPATGISLFLIGFLGFVTMTSATPLRTDVAWKKGVIIRNDQGVLNGEVYYDHRYDLVLLREEDGQSVRTFTARQVHSFRYYDSQDNIIHDFLVLAHHPVSPYSVPTFYEVVTAGKVLYLRRHNRCPTTPPPGVSPHTVAYDYFAYYHGQLVRSYRFEKELFSALTVESPALLTYSRKHRLRPYDIGDQILLVTYFNRHGTTPVAELPSF